MEELVNTSLERYFNALSKFGYKSYASFCFLTETAATDVDSV